METQTPLSDADFLYPLQRTESEEEFVRLEKAFELEESRLIGSSSPVPCCEDSDFSFASCLGNTSEVSELLTLEQAVKSLRSLAKHGNGRMPRILSASDEQGIEDEYVTSLELMTPLSQVEEEEEEFHSSLEFLEPELLSCENKSCQTSSVSDEPENNLGCERKQRDMSFTPLPSGVTSSFLSLSSASGFLEESQSLNTLLDFSLTEEAEPEVVKSPPPEIEKSSCSADDVSSSSKSHSSSFSSSSETATITHSSEREFQVQALEAAVKSQQSLHGQTSLPDDLPIFDESLGVPAESELHFLSTPQESKFSLSGYLHDPNTADNQVEDSVVEIVGDGNDNLERREYEMYKFQGCEEEKKMGPEGKILSGEFFPNIRKSTLCSFQPTKEHLEHFSKTFKHFAKLGNKRKSGVVISAKCSEVWLRQANVLDNILSSEEARLFFNEVAKRRLVLTIHDYLAFLHTVSVKKQIDLRLLIEKMNTCELQLLIGLKCNGQMQSSSEVKATRSLSACQRKSECNRKSKIPTHVSSSIPIFNFRHSVM